MNTTLTWRRSVRAGCCWWWGLGCRWTSQGRGAPQNPPSASRVAWREQRVEVSCMSACSMTSWWWRLRGDEETHRIYCCINMYSSSHCSSPYSFYSFLWISLKLVWHITPDHSRLSEKQELPVNRHIFLIPRDIWIWQYVTKTIHL